MTQKERMLSGRLYLASDPELRRDFFRSRRLTRQINATTEEQLEERGRLFSELLGALGENSYIETPFRCDYGLNIYIGTDFYANFDCIILDVCDVTIGNHVFFAPRVSIFSACHPIDAEIRDTQLELGKPVSIGESVWVGGNTVINPGVTIGSDVVIGSGSVVTRDIPSGVVAAGNPCRVLRPITEKDRAFWQAEREKFEADL